MRFAPILFGLSVHATSPAGVADMLPAVKGLLTNPDYISNAMKNTWSDAQLLSVLEANVPIDPEVTKILKSASTLKETRVFIDSHASAEDEVFIDSIPILPTLSATSPLARAGKALSCIMTQLEDKFLASNLVRVDRQALGLQALFETIAVPLYMTMTDAEFKTGAVGDRTEAETLWFNLIQQIHYRAVILHASRSAPEINLGESYRQFSIVAKFVLQTLISMSSQSDAHTAGMPDIPIGGGIVIPGVVADGCCALFWACLGQCIQRMMPTTTTTTTTPIPTEDPAIAAKRKVELTKYIQKVNEKIDLFQQLIAKVKLAHASGTDTAEFKTALDAVRLGALECYTEILTASLMNDHLTLDLAPTKARFTSISDSIGPAFDVRQYNAFLATLEESPALLRAELLEAARSQV